jgi:hypothetical protein
MSSKNHSVTSPKGTAIWPRLNEPDRKFQPEGVYSVRLRLEENAASDFQSKLQRIADDLYKAECIKQGKKTLKRAPLPWGPATDYDKENETRVEIEGELEFKFSMKAEVTTRAGKKWSQRPALFDAKLHPMPEDSEIIGGGSIIRVSAEIYPWYTASLGFGISLRPRAVQVIELRSGGATSNPAALGFEEEDGYTTVGASTFSDDADGDY